MRTRTLVLSNNSGVKSGRPKALRIAALASGLLMGALGLAIPPAAAASTSPTTMVNLGQASTYAVLSGASVANTVSAAGAPFTTLRGDLGVQANAQPTGFPPGVVTGATRVGTTATQAYTDLGAAYNEVVGRAGGTVIAGDLAGMTLAPGLYNAAAAVSNTGTLTLDGAGSPTAIFVLKVGGALAFAAASHVKLTNSASASRVFWQVNGAASVGAGSTFAGTIMASAAVAIGAGTVVNGRALALTGAITLDSNDFYSAPPVVTITGGATAITNHANATINGTTDVLAPGVVSVTIAGQTLTSTPSEGTWSVTSALLANGTYTVVASSKDGAGNLGTATQQLTVNTVPPVITINGGPTATTNNPTPTIAGTTDVVAETVVRVTVGSQALSALVQPGGTWNVTPTPLTDGTRTVAATVTDPAGNQSTATQMLTINHQHGRSRGDHNGWGKRAYQPSNAANLRDRERGSRHDRDRDRRRPDPDGAGPDRRGLERDRSCPG